MHATRVGLIGLLACVFVGCQANPIAMHNLDVAGDVIGANMESTGTLAKWRRVKSVAAVADVTYAQGGMVAERMQLSMDFWAESISASGQLPQGTWTAKVTADGQCIVTGRPAEPICSLLKRILHRTRGPLNLLANAESVKSVTRARFEALEGRDLSALSVQDSAGGPLAYYFDPTTNMLLFLTTGSEEPGSDGTVTRYTLGKEGYQMLPTGLVLPRRFAVFKVGKNVLLGEEAVLKVDLSDITVHEEPGLCGLCWWK